MMFGSGTRKTRWKVNGQGVLHRGPQDLEWNERTSLKIRLGPVRVPRCFSLLPPWTFAKGERKEIAPYCTAPMEH